MLWNETVQQSSPQLHAEHHCRPSGVVRPRDINIGEQVNIAPRSGESYIDYEDAIDTYYERKRPRLLSSSVRKEEKAIVHAVRTSLQNDAQWKRIHKLLKRTGVKTHIGILEEMLKGFKKTTKEGGHGTGGMYENWCFAITFNAPELPSNNPLPNLIPEAYKSIYPDKGLGGLPDLSGYGTSLLSSLYNPLSAERGSLLNKEPRSSLRSQFRKVSPLASERSLPLSKGGVSSRSLKSEQSLRGFRRSSGINSSSRSIDLAGRLRDELRSIQSGSAERTSQMKTNNKENRREIAAAALDAAIDEGRTGTELQDLKTPKRVSAGESSSKNKTLLELLEAANGLSSSVDESLNDRDEWTPKAA